MGAEEDETWPTQEEEGHVTSRADRPLPPAAKETTPHELGLSFGIPENVLTAIEHQAGSSKDMPMADLSNMPELFFMRLLDQTKLGEEGEETPIPAALISKLMQWWRRAIILCPPETAAPPPQKVIHTQMMPEAAPEKPLKRKLGGVVEQRDDTLYESIPEKTLAQNAQEVL